MRVVIAGLPKSGTTVLYSALKQSLPRDYVYLFEPQKFEGASPDVLAKILLGDPLITRDFESFDKKIFLARDPRDILISQLLYWIYDLPFYGDDQKVNLFLAKLSQKQTLPVSVSVVELVKLLSQLSNFDLLTGFVKNHKFAGRFHLEHPAYFEYRYEDFLAGNLTALENYLGVTVSFSGSVDQEFARVVRSKRSGDWRDWFTSVDVEYFQPIFQDFLNNHDYDLDWSLNPHPVILPEHSTEYVKRLVAEKRTIQTIYDLQHELTIKVAERDKIILDQQAALAAQAEGIAFLRTTIAERDQIILDRQSALASRDEGIAFLRNTIAELENAQARLQTALQNQITQQAVEREKYESLIKQALAESEQQLNNFRHDLELANVRLAERDKLIQQTQSEVLSQARKIGKLETEATEGHRALSDARQMLTIHHANQEFLKKELASRTATVQSRDEAVSWLQQEVAVFTRRTVEAEHELEKIHRSRWWRLASHYWRWFDSWLSLAAMIKRLIPRRAKFVVVRLAREQQARVEQHRLKTAIVESASSVGDRQATTLQLVIQPTLPDEMAVALTTHLPSGPQVRYDVICFSIVDWDFRFQRPQQLMLQFAKHGHRVFYLKTTRFLSPDAAVRFRLREVAPNLYEVELAARRFPDIYGSAITGAEKDSLLESLETLRTALSIETAVAYVQVPVWTEVAIATRRRWGWRVIYDCMDDWASFPDQNPATLEDERQLVQACDLMLVSGQLLWQKWAQAGRAAVIVRNGVDLEFYRQRYKPNELLAHLPHPIIGYFGALAEWLDVDLLIEAARQHPDWNFVMLGGVFQIDVSKLAALPNVMLPGNQPYELMPKYLWHFDVCLIPFKLNTLTHATDPVKFYEYISAGKPVVAMALKELEPYRDVVYLAEDRQEFLALLDRAVHERDPHLLERRRQLAAHHTWAVRYQQTATAIAAQYPLVSVVVVTYGNVALTRLCLESVLARTEYPAFELIVVDNRSPDDTASYLCDLASRDTRVKLILNKNNLGFAKANNQGLAISAGQHLVLLNNDTIVPPNWLTRLVEHLSDAEIGLVGPVTNWAGNEARLEVVYTTWAEMEQFALQRSAACVKQVFDIPMLAFYCVALRREVLEKVGMLDEQFGIGMFEDDDYAMRVRQAGYRVVCAEDVFVHHFGQAAFKYLIQTGAYDPLFESNRRRYEAKWNVKWIPHQFRESGNPE